MTPRSSDWLDAKVAPVQSELPEGRKTAVLPTWTSCPSKYTVAGTPAYTTRGDTSTPRGGGDGGGGGGAGGGGSGGGGLGGGDGGGDGGLGGALPYISQYGPFHELELHPALVEQP